MHFSKYITKLHHAIINNNGDNEKKPLWILTSAWICCPPANSTFWFFITFMIDFKICSNILNIFRYFITQVYGWILCTFLLSIHAMAIFFNLIFTSLRMYWFIYNRSSVPLVLLWNPLCFFGNSPWHSSK